MFACIFFEEDASLSVVGKAKKDLKFSGEFKAEEKVEMIWGKPGKGRKELYHGTIIRVNDDQEFLTKWATEANKKVLKRLETKPDSVPKELFSFKLYTELKSSPAKRHRVLTARIKENMRQDDELSLKKKKKNIQSGKGSDTRPPNSKEPKNKKPDESENSTASVQKLKTDTPSSMRKEKKTT